MLSPAEVREISTSSARPAITARPSPCGSRGSGSSGPPSGPGMAPHGAGSPFAASGPGAALSSPSRAAASVTTTSNRPAMPVSSIRTGSAGQCTRCASTAREHASPTARRTSSRSASCTPLRRATAVATSRAVRTCTGSGVKLISTVAIDAVSAVPLLLRFPGRNGLIHGVVDAEDLREPRDPEDLKYPLLSAYQVERPIVGPDTLEPADEHPEAGRVKELDLLHVHHELVVPVVDELDEKLAQARRRVDVDLALHVDDFNPVLGVVVQLQIHKSSSAITAVVVFKPERSRTPPSGEHLSRRAFNHALRSCLHEFTLRGTSPTDVTLGVDGCADLTRPRGGLCRRPDPAPGRRVGAACPRGAHRGAHRAAGTLARVGTCRAHRAILRHRGTRAVGAPSRRGRLGPLRQERDHLDSRRVRQIAGLPAARTYRGSGGRHRAVCRADRGARR